ncbi:hypothetical protein N3K66_001915 [Trichothecium roseum]|uniref:Uncharacterized protein n=1 Tax=Trichothecium roseum TaxID=47278 RepID=A0ACC0V8V5_9HYPO|nr:hypothetical protein N3K66_001915 [Trichothecium roseum]
MNIFGLPRRPTSEWYAVGLTSSFPDVASQNTSLSEFSLCDASRKPGCRVFEIPKEHGAQVTEIAFVEGNSENHFEGGELKDQVLVFQYKGKYHAVDHQCPHSSYPLSEGAPFDIEDFGVILSAGLTCPKHGWSFDLFTGHGDRGNYRLAIWEVQVRDLQASLGENGTESSDKTDQEIWVRRKPRIG